ncbi:MAG: hypothetical protein WC977_02015 [Anaerovoracaceae bacterium]|jgi:hypothetical protein
MSKLVKQQKAEIRRQAARIELERMRAHVAGKRRKLTEIESQEREWTKARKAERRARLRALRKAIGEAVKAAGRFRKAKLATITEKRRQFVEWWQQVRAERAARLAEIKRLRLELRDWSKQGPARRKEAIEQIAAEAQRQLAAFDAETLEGLDVLGDAIRKARAELRSDEYDLKQWTSNRRRDATRGRPVKAAVRRKESAAELVSNIEANLESAEEWAWWRRQRPSILRTAKELGKTAGDEIAEMIREQVEENPEQALDFLAADADAWVEAEVRKQGFAA